MKSLQRKLTYSYFLVTVVIAAVAVCVPEIYLNARENELMKLRIWLGTTLVPELETALGPAGLESDSFKLHGVLAGIDRAPFTVDDVPSSIQIQTLSFVSPQRTELVTWPARTEVLDSLPLFAQDDVDDALSGADPIGSEMSGNEFIVMGSIYAPESRRIVGAILVTADWHATLPAVTRAATQIASRPSMLLFIMALVIGGTVFGWLVSRPISRRVRTMSDVAGTWGSGDLSASVESSEPDELGKLGDDLDAMAAHLSELMAERSNLAAEQERNSLARDLHDTVKQHLFAANLQLSTVVKLLDSDPAAARNALSQAGDLYRKATEDLSAILVGDSDLTTGKGGYPAAIERLVGDWSKRTRIPCDVSTSECELTASAQVELHRVLQEALANIERHAQASSARVSLLQGEDSIELTIEDNGIGFDPESCRAGLGLRSMSARVSKLGGELSVLPATDDGGTRVNVRVPIDGVDPEILPSPGTSRNATGKVSHG